MNALLGQMLGRYQVQQLLGQGRLGHVYQAVDVNLERLVALKVLAAPLTSQPEFATRFAQLARVAIRAEHPGLVRVYDFGQAADHYFVAMELLQPPTLAQMLATLHNNQQWITLAEARELVLTIGRAVEAAQRQGSRRLLITPEQIMFRWGEAGQAGQPAAYQPVLVDLGLATLLAESDMTPRRLPSQLLAYLAPELILHNQGDVRSEIYMLGALFYALTLGQPPLQVETVGQAVDAHLHQAIPLPQTVTPDLPASVTAVLQQAMAYAPDARYLTLAALLDALTALPGLDTSGARPAHATAGVVSLATFSPHSPHQAGATSTLPLRSSALPVAEMTLHSPDPIPSAPADDLALPTLTLAAHLQVIAPDGTIQWIELNTPSLTIGRVLENDLVLDDPRVSRRHARLEASGNQWRLVDLQSANGTFIGKQRIPVGIGVEWQEEQPVQIGSYRLRLVREQVGLITKPTGQGTPAHTGVYLPSLRREVERSQIHTSTDGGVGLYLVEPAGAIDPGYSIAFRVILLNQRLTAERLSLKLTGLPPGWVQSFPAHHDLEAGEQRQILLTVAPPRSPQSRPERYGLRLEVSNQRAPDQRAHAEIELTVKAFVRFRAEAQPAVVQVGEPLQLHIKNQGNALQTFTLMWEDEPRGELHFTSPQTDLQIPPGMTGMVELNTMLRKPRWLGGPREHLLHIQIATPDHPAQQLVVKLISRGRLR